MWRNLTLIALLVGASTSAAAATIATSAEPTAAMVVAPLPSGDAPAPRDIMLGIVSLDVFVGSSGEMGGRVGMDMLSASGRGPIRFAGGLRFLLGGGGGFGPDFQLAVGVAHAVSDRTVVALVAPVGATVTTRPDLTVHGYVGLEVVAAFGERGRGGGMVRPGVELAAEISNRGGRARVGVVRPGKDIGLGVGVQWQRDADISMLGVYIAETAGK